jgi:hypothetical protein
MPPNITDKERGIADQGTNDKLGTFRTAKPSADDRVAQTVPDSVVKTWKTFGSILTTLPSTKFRIARSPNAAWTAANAAVMRMLLMSEGAALVADLPVLLKRGSVFAKVNVRFMDRSAFPSDEEGGTHESAGGFFEPRTGGAKTYDIYVEWVDDLRSNELPGSAGSYFLGASGMADSVFHELLHIWFVHRFPQAGDDLGHNVPRTKNDAAFQERLDRFQSQLNKFDSDLHGSP